MENPSEMNQEIIGSRKGDYEVLELLGTGGMGRVFKVRNVFSDRIEAMKVLLPNTADQKILADRFVREIKVLAGLHHPNIAELRTALTINNELVMIMEYVEGATLAARIHQGAIPYGQALGYIEQVLSALSYAHKQHIIHRDIKPSNMMLTPEGVVKLMDFGIAQRADQGDLTRTNTTVGSFAYMSPEQIKAEAVDGRSDLYSVGVSLYEMVTGQRPFPSETAFAALQAHLQTPPKPPVELRPDLPEAISQLILMAIAKDPAARFQTADAFAAALQSVKPNVAGTAAGIPVPAAATARSAAAGSGGGTGTPATKIASTSAAPGSVVQAIPMPPAAKTHRGLYITLGAVIVFAVLAAAAVVPRHVKTAPVKKQNTASVPTTAPQPVTTPATPAASATADTSGATIPATSGGAPGTNAPTETQPANPATGTTSSPPASPVTQPATGARPAAAEPSSGPAQPTAEAKPTAPTQSTPHARTRPRSAPAASQAGSAPSAPAASESNAAASPQPAAPDPAQVQALDLENDQLSSRASAVNASLDTLQKQQEAQGLGLRGDIVASQQRMEAYLQKAQAAIQAQDTTVARKYLDLAAVEVEKIEKFLGR
jgi:eukaryotic-like serine/threonine-protein kinase